MPILRRLSDGDLPEVLRVQEVAYAATLNEPGEAFAAKIGVFPAGAIGCFEGADMIGYVFSVPWTLGEVMPLHHAPLLPRRGADCLYVHDMAVQPDRRGRGVAVRLLEALTEVALKEGLRHLALTAVQGSEGFWARLGFQEERRFEYAPGVPASYMVAKVP